MILKHKDSTASILEFLQIEKNCYDQILELMKEQTLAIEQENEKKLDAVIEKKDALLKITRDNESHLEAAVAKFSDKELTKTREQAGKLKNEIESVLAQIIEMENNCQAELKARKFLTQDKIIDLKKKRSLLKGYGNSQRIKPRISRSV